MPSHGGKWASHTAGRPKVNTKLVNTARSPGPRLSPEELIVSRFSVEMEGLLVATFTECSGLSATVEVETIQEGGLNNFEHKLPGRTSFGNITLGSGVASSNNLWDWFYDVTMGKVVRRNVSIIMYSQNRSEAMRWNLEAAYPVSWQGPSFTAGDASITVHSLELAHHGLSRAL